MRFCSTLSDALFVHMERRNLFFRTLITNPHKLLDMSPNPPLIMHVRKVRTRTHFMHHIKEVYMTYLHDVRRIVFNVFDGFAPSAYPIIANVASNHALLIASRSLPRNSTTHLPPATPHKDTTYKTYAHVHVHSVAIHNGMTSLFLLFTSPTHCPQLCTSKEKEKENERSRISAHLPCYSHLPTLG
jgi:hypothetical protein